LAHIVFEKIPIYPRFRRRSVQWLGEVRS